MPCKTKKWKTNVPTVTGSVSIYYPAVHFKGLSILGREELLTLNAYILYKAISFFNNPFIIIIYNF